MNFLFFFFYNFCVLVGFIYLGNFICNSIFLLDFVGEKKFHWKGTPCLFRVFFDGKGRFLEIPTKTFDMENFDEQKISRWWQLKHFWNFHP